MVYETPLRKFDYKVIHFDSPDQRGIDVSMLFRKGLFTKDTAFAIPIKFPGNLESKTRDILYVKGSFDQKDTIHLFVNHWPSRYGGYLETKPLREYVASVLKSATDSLFSINPYSKIVIMGDFNDGPYEDSFANHLQSKNDTSDFGSSDLINLMAFVEGGTLKYQGGWDVFDQIIVSGAMLYEKGYQVQNKKANIYAPDFLMQEDEKYLGKKPFRTYNGFKYLGGFSDHLPVYVDIKLE